MLISIVLMVAQTAATPVDPADSQIEPVINVCPTEPSVIPPFGESCAAREQAERAAAILGAVAKPPTRAERYKIINDGKVIANDRGEIVATASPCLLPTVAPQDPALVANAEPATATSAIERCKTHKFAVQFSTSTATDALVKSDPKVAPKPAP